MSWQNYLKLLVVNSILDILMVITQNTWVRIHFCVLH